MRNSIRIVGISVVVASLSLNVFFWRQDRGDGFWMESVASVPEELLEEEESVSHEEQLGPREKEESVPNEGLRKKSEQTLPETTSAPKFQSGVRERDKPPAKGLKRPVFFLKTHKTGSTSLQNILFRYGYDRGLNFAYPQQHQFGELSKFQVRHVKNIEQAPFDFFVHHSRLNENFDSWVPKLFGGKPAPLFLTILRDPAGAVPSALAFYYASKHVSVEDLIENKAQRLMSNSDPGPYLRNGMAIDLSARTDHSKFVSQQEAQRIIRLLDAKFELVMITEYFDESLMLLRHMLGWEMIDVVHLVTNKNEKNKVERKPKHSEELKKKIREWAAADWTIYQHFKQVLEEKMNAFGRDKLASEVKEFRELVSHYVDLCYSGKSNDKTQLHNLAFWMVPGLKLSYSLVKPSMLGNSLCRSMARSEIRFAMRVFHQQYPDPSGKRYFPLGHGSPYGKAYPIPERLPWEK